jgi:flagellar biosynthesis protein FlhG
MNGERLVPALNEAGGGPLAVPRAPLLQPAPLGEALGLSRLGSRLMNLARREAAEPPAARVVCVASGKGGTGKSILSSNLAVMRARRGERVLLVDFDAGLANAHLLLGLAPQHDLSHVLQGQVRAEDALVAGPHGLKLLSGGVGRHILANPTRRELDRLFKALRPLEDQFDLIVIDHGAGVSYSTVTHLAAAHALLLVTNHEVTALSDGYALYKRAHLVNPYIRVGLVLNRVPDEARAQSAWERFQSASQRFLGHAPEFVGWVPYDPAVLRSVEARTPVALCEPESAAARAIEALSHWAPIDQARGARAFFDRARAALR